jgi:hypothetical protein
MAEALVGRLQHLLAIPFSYDGGEVYLSAAPASPCTRVPTPATATR